MGQDDKTTIDNQSEYLEKIAPSLYDLGFDVHSIFPNADWLHAAINKHNEHDDFATHQETEEIKKRLKTNNKGFVVNECLSRFKESDTKIILHIDGSKAFNLKSIIHVAQCFLEPSIDAVLTVRKNDTGISKPRQLLEDFERFVVSNSFNKTAILDGQSGCWSFKLKNEIYITAIGYEIELDILTELLKLNANILWKDIDVYPRKPSQYDYLPDSIQKLKFICNKLRITKSTILSLLQEFSRLHEKRIKDIDSEEKRNGTNRHFSNYKKAIEKID
jgi:hypothetical protein